MKKIKVVSFKNLPTRLPVYQTALVWLLLDRSQPAGWVWGVVGTVVAIMWILACVLLCLEEKVELAELGDDTNDFEFQKRVARAMVRASQKP